MNAPRNLDGLLRSLAVGFDHQAAVDAVRAIKRYWHGAHYDGPAALDLSPSAYPDVMAALVGWMNRNSVEPPIALACNRLLTLENAGTAAVVSGALLAKAPVTPGQLAQARRDLDGDFNALLAALSRKASALGGSPWCKHAGDLAHWEALKGKRKELLVFMADRDRATLEQVYWAVWREGYAADRLNSVRMAANKANEFL